MLEENLNFYERMVKAFFLKKEFSDYLSPARNVLFLNILKDRGMIEQLTKTTVDSLKEESGIAGASFMYRNPNFLELKESRGTGFLGTNYIFSIAGEAKNAYLYMQRIGKEDTYCKNFVFSEQGRYGDITDCVFFFRNLFLLTALVFEQGTSAEKKSWGTLIKNNEDNIFGFILAKARELKGEISEEIRTYLNAYSKVYDFLKTSQRYDKYAEFSQCIVDIGEVKISKVLNKEKEVGCYYKMSDFNCYGDIFYRAIFNRENSFSRNFFPPTVKINSNGEVISENIDFSRLGNEKLTKKNKKLANQIIMEEIKTVFGEKINKRIELMYSNFEQRYPDKEGDSNILLKRMEEMYFSMKKINETFNSIITNICFMK